MLVTTTRALIPPSRGWLHSGMSCISVAMAAALMSASGVCEARHLAAAHAWFDAEQAATQAPATPANKPASAGAVVVDEESAPASAQDAPQTQPDAGPGADKLETEESIARSQQLLQRRPFHGPAFTALVNHFLEQGKLDDLIADYTARAEALPDDIPLRIVLARLHLRQGEAEQAAALIDTIERLPPDLARLNSELLVFKSEVYQRVGNNDAAERMLKSAMEPPHASSVSERLRLGEALADLYLRQDRKDDAVTSLRALAAEFPDQYLHQRHVGEAMAQRGLVEPALEHYQAMLALVKDEVDKRCEVLRQIGLLQERLGMRDGAIAAYSEAIGLLASDHWLQRELHERIVGLYRASNRLEDLAEYCRTQITRAPEQTAMRVLLADVLAALNKADEAKATLAEAVELFPSDIALSQKRIEFLERIGGPGDIEGAGSEYQRIIGRHADDAELYIAYGQFLANNRQVEAARNQWQHVLGTHVADPGLANRLGALFETYELYDDAAQTYERAIALAPQQPEGYLALSRLWLVRKDSDKAIATLQRAAEANPDDSAIHAAVAAGMLNLGKADEALTAIERACELLPEQVRYQQMRADLLVHAGRLEEALQVRRQSIDLITNPLQRADAINVLVSMHASADRLAALKEQEQARLVEKPADAVSLLLLARTADIERDFQAARKWLDTLLAADASNETALQNLARLQDATGDVDAAVQTYQRIIQLHPARGRPSYEAIVDLKLRYGDKAGAVETLERMVKDDPGNTGVLNAVAEQLVRMGDPERALPFYEESLQLQPDRHETRLEYGKALADVGRLDDAMTAFRAVATQRADTDSAVEALGRLHDTATQLGVLEELIDELQQQVETDPSNTLIARALAQLLVREFEYGRAMELLDLVLRNNPRDVDLALGRAELHRRLAQFDQAIEGYQHVLRQPQIDRDYVLGEMGKAYFESGQVDQARRLWRDIQNRLYAGSLLKNNGLIDEAVAVFEEGIRLKPDDYALHRNLIGALEAAGKTDEALKAARRLLDLEPGNVMNIDGLARACLKYGDRAGAAEVAARLFSAGVSESKPRGAGGAGGYNLANAMYRSMYSQYGYGGYGMGGPRSNLQRGIQFFQENGMLAELEEVLNEQIAAQPDNSGGGAVLKQAAADLFAAQLSKPERALVLLRELETAAFPIEHQQWLGQCSQRDHLRVRQYNLIASKPTLRDATLAQLEPKEAEQLTRDNLLELAIIRNAQGNADAAIDLLQRAVGLEQGQGDGAPIAGALAMGTPDLLARGLLVDLLIASERFADAEPHAVRLIDLLAAERERMHGEMIDRVRRDFVRTLPLEFQLRMTDELLSDIADKWTLGQGFVSWSAGSVRTMGYLRSRLSLATVYAETERIEQARAIWQDLAPGDAPDVDTWTMLGSVAQLHDQDDLAFDFYQQAMHAARALARDPLLQQIYATSIAQSSWYGENQSIDSSFNKIVGAFARRDGLIELYDFLRDTDQDAKARRIAEQYKLDEQLQTLYAQRVQEAAEEFRKGSARPGGDADAFERSVGYFAQVAKLAELHDRGGFGGSWDKAQAVYEEYLRDFPDELGLLTTLGEVAEANDDLDQAIEWEKRVLEAKTHLSRRARQWNMRDLTLTPSVPQALKGGGAGGGGRYDPWTWSTRWGTGTSGRYSYYGYGSGFGPLERAPSWMRLAQLHLANQNPIAAGDAMQRAVADAGNNREDVIQQVLGLIRQRQLIAQMLPVLRSLAVYAPNDENVQLAFAESLEAGERKDLAAEVCSRMLRRGVSDLGVLEQVRRKLQTLNPGDAPPEATLASLEADVAADPSNLKNRLRLAKAYYYALQVDRALETLRSLAEEAPHLEDVHSLLVEIYTLRGEPDNLIEALKAQIGRTSEEGPRRAAQWRLVDELLAAGRNDEALQTVQELGDSRDPMSYQRIGALLHYFGRHDDAIKQYEQGLRSQAGARYNPYGRDGSSLGVARSLVLKDDLAGAADKILAGVDEQMRQQVQYAGVYGLYNDQASPFTALKTIFVLHPGLALEVLTRIEERRSANPDDPQATKLVMQLHRSLGRPDLADAMLEQMVDKASGAGGGTDQGLMVMLIDRAMKKKDFDRAIALAEGFIAQQPKPQLPPGVPPQYAGMMVLQSPRTFMVCKLGDVYWDMGQKDKAFEVYKQILDDQVDETRTAYAFICMVRERLDEARQLIDEALAAQEVKSPTLLEFRAFIAAMDGQSERVFDLIAEAVSSSVEDQDARFAYGEGGSPTQALALLVTQQGVGGGPGALLDRFSAFMRERIAKHPNEWENYQVLASTLSRCGRVAEALAALDQAAAVPTIAQQALQQKVSMQQGFAGPDELIALYEKALELSERNVDSAQQQQQMYAYPGMAPARSPSGTRDALGQLLWEKGDAASRARAETIWTERRNAQDAQTHIWLGDQFMRLNVRDRAEQAYRKALELDPENTAAHLALADMAYQDGERRDAFAHMLVCFVRSQNAAASQRGARQGPWYQGMVNDARMNQWAVEIARDAEIASTLSAVAGDDQAASDAAQGRLMLAMLTGDWESLERELRETIDAGTYDPMMWTLWAHVQQRKAAWEEAATAWSFLRRARHTTIADHREQLRLVLAGKQIKEAAAGTRQAQPGGATPAMPVGMPATVYPRYSSMDFYYGNQLDAAASELAAINIQLGRLSEAERLYLLSSGGAGVTAALPAVASLMWQQRAHDRALELMRLALVLGDERSSGTSSLPQYASMLAEAGQVDAAIDLLVRGYRLAADERQDMYAAMYGAAYAGQDQQFEQGAEQQCAQALHGILKRSGRHEQALGKLTAEAVADPTDARLAKLVLSLQMQARRWEDASASLSAWRAARPDDLPLTLQQLQVCQQLQQWDEALRLLERIKQETPRDARQWCANEAFIHLMKGDADAAVAAIQPLLDDPLSTDQTVAPSVVWTALACAKRYDLLIAYLEASRAQAGLDLASFDLLMRCYQAQGRWNDALRLGLEEFWKQPLALSESDPCYRALCQLMQSARSVQQALASDAARPADAALLALIAHGPRAGIDAFAALAGKAEDSLEARRGLVLSAVMAGDSRLALQANRQVLEWLEPRRRESWHAPAPASIAQLARAAMTQYSRGGTTTMAMSGSTAQMLSQASMSAAYQRSTITTYEELWRSHERLQRDLLPRAGEDAALDALLASQARAFRAESGDRDEYAYAYGYPPGMPMPRMPAFQMAGDDDATLTADRQGLLREVLWRNNRMAELLRLTESVVRGIPVEQWSMLSDAYAATGREEDALRLRQAAADVEFARMRAADTPSLASANRYSWRWYWYNASTQEAYQIRAALRGAFADDKAEDPERARSAIDGEPDQIWERAMIDPAMEQALVRCDAEVGQGWGETQTLRQLISYFRAKREPAKIIALLERVFGADQVLRGQFLDAYLWACFHSRDDERIDRVLTKALEFSSTLENDVALVRLAVLRRQGKDAEADELEKDLLDRCAQDLPNPVRLDRALYDPAPRPIDDRYLTRQRNQNQYSYSSSYGGRRSYSWNSTVVFVDDLPTVPRLAQALGVPYQSSVTPDDLTIEAIRQVYLNHGLYAHAARVLEQEVAAASTPRERLALVSQRVDALRKAGDKDAAHRAALECEKLIEEAIQQSPTDGDLHWRLGRLYHSEAYGRDYSKAHDALATARNIDPAYDTYGLQAVECLYKDGRYKEAWAAFSAAMQGGVQQVCQQPMLHYAALAAHHSGDIEAAQPLLRLAVHRYPTNALAQQVREVIHDAKP